MEFNDLVFLSTREQDTLASILDKACAQWHSKWFSHLENAVESTLFNLTADNYEPFCALPWHKVTIGQYRTYATDISNKPSELTALLLPALDASKVDWQPEQVKLEEQVIDELVSEVFNDGIGNLPDSGNTKLSCSHLIGQCLWQVKVGNFSLSLLIPTALVVEIVQRKVAKGSAIDTDLASLVANKPVNLRIKLDSFQTSMGTLRELKVGDILETHVSLDTPLTLVTDNDKALAQCYIGKSDQSKAIVLSGKNRT